MEEEAEGGSGTVGLEICSVESDPASCLEILCWGCQLGSLTGALVHFVIVLMSCLKELLLLLSWVC